MNALDIDAFITDIRARGYGLTVNVWSVDEPPPSAVAVVLWLDGKIVMSASGQTMTEALEALAGKLPAAVFDGQAPTSVRGRASRGRTHTES